MSAEKALKQIEDRLKEIHQTRKGICALALEHIDEIRGNAQSDIDSFQPEVDQLVSIHKSILEKADPGSPVLGTSVCFFPINTAGCNPLPLPQWHFLAGA